MVKRILPAMEVDMGGHPVLQPLPTRAVQQLDPFLLLHHHSGVIPAHSHPLSVGVGPHPHRGFSPVTFIFQGDVHHRDSRGNSHVVEAGGVQWMDAGMGIVHSERPTEALAERGGAQEIIQLWINLPASLKMKTPAYLAAQQVDMPRLQGLAGDVRLVSGSWDHHHGPIHPAYPATTLMGTWAAGDVFELQHTPGDTAMLYLLDGGVRMVGHGLVEGQNLIQLDEAAENYRLEARSTTRFIYLTAAPIGESVSQYGPFVMNTQTQVLEALRDAQMGKMGVLIEA
jgi:redox-sensitive bicupin YhaK (pirin superfamily)